jgi:inhibitor of KinA sporulation pathway (predicted exonuclease)
MAKSVSRKARRFATVFDLEFTAWEGSQERRWSLPGERKEVVQIGAVKLDAESLRVVDSFDMLVQPRLNPVLSEYLIALTGITNQELAERGVDFVTAYRAFLEFVGDDVIFAFGRDDLVFIENIKIYGWQRELILPPYRNVIPWFAEHGVDLAGKHACDVAEAAGAEFEGQRHNALADAAGVTRGMIAMVARGIQNPFVAEPVSE